MRLKLLTVPFLLLLIPAAAFIVMTLLFPLPIAKLTPPGSTVVLDRDGQLLRAFLAPDEMWRIRTKSSEISPTLKAAVLAYEDRRFYWHPGIDPIAVARAAIANLRAGKVVQGGSTITMQVARMMEPRERSLMSKLIEAFRALQLEAKYAKEEILALYFNLAPYGGNIIGVGAASRFYFNKSPDQLSLGEACLLAAIPNSPNLYRPDLNIAGARQGRDKVLEILISQGKITSQQMAEAKSEPIPSRRFELPFSTPHFADLLVRKFPRQERLESTIDHNIQALADRVLRSRISPLLPLGITNGSVVVIDNKKGDVLALVGSSDYFDSANGGQVNGVIAPRSPGSALKPFVYALSINEGLISPQSILYDVPVEYSGYKPVNYDETYHGAVTVEEALVRSLNVPAVNLSAKVGADGVYDLLKRGGVTTLTKPSGHYGLSLVLGGCEVTLLELTSLYSGLANGGRVRPYRLLRTQERVEPKPLLTDGTCFIITQILCQLRRPELPAVWDASVNLPKVAWKTGTSFGKRDAWSIGYTPQYTIGVWVGNFDGKGHPALVGAEVAAPILFTLFEALGGESGNRWFVQPSDVARRQVCAVSGMIPSPYCAARRDELYIPGVSPTQPCNMHEMILVDKKSNKRLCSHCRGNREYEKRIVVRWPVEIATWMERNGYPVEAIPEHYARCPKVASGAVPLIASPAANSDYYVRPEVDVKYQKVLLDASVSNGTKTIYWFLNRQLIYSGKPDARVFITPTPGVHTLICMDDEGRSTEIEFTVHRE